MQKSTSIPNAGWHGGKASAARPGRSSTGLGNSFLLPALIVFGVLFFLLGGINP